MFDLFLKKTINNICFLFLLIQTTFHAQQNVNINVTLNLTSVVANLDILSQNNDLNMNSNIDCVQKFFPILSTLPSNCQSQIVSVFKANLIPGRCCLPDVFVNTVKNCFQKNLNSFTNTMTNISRSNKKSFSCFKNNEVFKAINNIPIYKEEKDNDDQFLREILKNYNMLSHLLSKCLAGLNVVSLQMLSRMCIPTASLSKFFTKDSKGNFNSIIKRKQDDIDTFKACSEYLKTHTSVSDTLLNSYVDQVNYLLGVDQCNYFSDFFNFDVSQDKEDLFFPNSYVPNKSPDSFDSLVSQWSICTSSNSLFPSFTVSNLKAKLGTALKSNPYGLSSSIGRSEINYDIIKRTFPLEKYPDFHIKCNGNSCIANCNGCNDLVWESNKVITSSNVVDFQVSCCKGICVVLIQLQNPSVIGAEVYQVTGDPSTRVIDSLLKEKVKNAQFCFDFKKNKTNTINSTNTGNSDPTKNLSTTNNSSLFNFTNFTDDKIRSVMSDIQNNPQNYLIDFRLGTALNLLLRPYNNSTTVTLMNYLTQDLYAKNNSFYFFCEQGNCTYQCKNCSNSNTSFLLYSNTTLNRNISSNLKLSRVTTPTISSPTKGKVVSNGSSSKSSGSSLTGGSTSTISNGSSSKSSGSSLTGGSTSTISNGSSSKSSGSSLTGGSTSTISGSPSSTSSGSLFTGSSITSSSGSSTKSGGSTINGSSFSFSSNTNKQTNSNINPYNTNLGKSTSSSFNTNNSVNLYNYGSGTVSKLSYSQPVSSTVTNKYIGYTSNSIYSNNYYSTSTTKSYISTRTYNSGGIYTYSKNYNSNFLNSYSYSFSSRNTNNKLYFTTYYKPSYSYSIRFYTYRPTYYYYYNPYSYYLPSWGFYSYYYIPNYNFYYYRALNPNNNSANRAMDVKQNLPNPSYNPLDWMPNYRAPFDLTTYMSNINNKINSIKIYVECCKLFCVTYIESFDDGVSLDLNGRKRIFIDVNLRNYLFLDSSQLSPSTKKCIMTNLYSKLANGTITNNSTDQKRSLDTVNNCGLETPFKTFPLKNSCRNELSQYCGLNNFDVLIERFYPSNYKPQCNISLICPNVTYSSKEDDQAACGANLASNLMINNLRVSYTNVAFPCNNSDSTQSSSLRLTSLIQTHKMKIKSSQFTASKLQYLNESALSSNEKAELNTSISSVQKNNNITVVIDSNNNIAAALNVEGDLSKINADIPSNKTSLGNLYEVSMALILLLTIILF